MTSEERVREPQQVRSRARVDRLLAAADRILGAEGYDALTIARLTDEAGVPVGTFYQFFDDKDAIVEVLARRYVAETGKLIAALVGEVLELPPGTRLAAAFDAFARLYRTNPAYRAIRAGSYTSSELRRADDANVAAVVEGVRRILVTGTSVKNGDDVLAAGRTLQLIADTLLYRTGELPARKRAAFVMEAKAILSLLETDAIERLST